jgi:tetratricopeptide (TPR) repeat protein
LLDRAFRAQHAALRAAPGDRLAMEFLEKHHKTRFELFQKQGRSAEAAAACERFIDDFKERASYFGGLPGQLRHVALWRLNQGVLLKRAKRLDDADRALQASLTAHRRLGSEEPADLSERARALHVFAELSAELGRPEAVAQFRQAIRLQRAAARAQPGEPEYRGLLRQHHIELGLLLLKKKDVATAALVAGDLAAVRPLNHDDALEAARLLARCLPLAGEEAPELRWQMRRCIEQAVLRCPAEPRARNNLAWDLVMAREKELRDAPRAVALARLAVQARPLAGGSWNTLGIALYRAGDLAEAITALQQSMRFRKGGDGHDWLIMALIYQRRGDVKLARQWYERSLRWLKTHKQTSDDLRLLLDEAKALLGK